MDNIITENTSACALKYNLKLQFCTTLHYQDIACLIVVGHAYLSNCSSEINRSVGT